MLMNVEPYVLQRLRKTVKISFMPLLLAELYLAFKVWIIGQRLSLLETIVSVRILRYVRFKYGYQLSYFCFSCMINVIYGIIGYISFTSSTSSFSYSAMVGTFSTQILVLMVVGIYYLYMTMRRHNVVQNLIAQIFPWLITKYSDNLELAYVVYEIQYTWKCCGAFNSTQPFVYKNGLIAVGCCSRSVTLPEFAYHNQFRFCKPA